MKFDPPDDIVLSDLLGLHGNATISVRAAPFSLMTQNMALVVFPAGYVGTNRDGALAEIISQIRSLVPDVVGLCEVFSDGERDHLVAKLKDIYPHFADATDSEDMDSDGGQLVLSKAPISQVHHLVFEAGVGDDAWANKGVIHIRVHPPDSPSAFDVFYSHTQSTYSRDLRTADEDHREALLTQLLEMRAFIQIHSDRAIPAFIMGDLNIAGNVPEDLDQLITRLGDPVDLWLSAGNTPASGFTIDQPQADKATNFYEDDDDNDHEKQRLDYILMKAGSKFIPIVRSIEVKKFRHSGRFISDHFGLHARFEELVEVQD
jgi:endonuclease/exonuclease/phosphatase family metal-dependent hydrolase